jgi:hypothetical protein
LSAFFRSLLLPPDRRLCIIARFVESLGGPSDACKKGGREEVDQSGQQEEKFEKDEREIVLAPFVRVRQTGQGREAPEEIAGEEGVGEESFSQEGRSEKGRSEEVLFEKDSEVRQDHKQEEGVEEKGLLRPEGAVQEESQRSPKLRAEQASRCAASRFALVR